MEKNKSIVVRLTEKEFRLLEAICKNQKITISEATRYALSFYSKNLLSIKRSKGDKYEN